MLHSAKLALVDRERRFLDFRTGLADLASLAGLAGLAGACDYTILLSKWTVGFLERLDRLSKGSAIINSFNKINLMNSSILWVPRNAKALKCIVAADEGIAAGDGPFGFSCVM